MLRKSIILFCCAAWLLFGLNLIVMAQDSAWEKLTKNPSFECRFLAGKSAAITEFGKAIKVNKDGSTIISNGKWNINEKMDKKFPSITFRQISRGEGFSLTAKMSGNASDLNPVSGVIGAGYITFIESREMGGVSVTTIFAEFDENHELIAVHSRHSKVFSTVIPSQYYGSCRPIAP